MRKVKIFILPWVFYLTIFSSTLIFHYYLFFVLRSMKKIIAPLVAASLVTGPISAKPVLKTSYTEPTGCRLQIIDTLGMLEGTLRKTSTDIEDPNVLWLIWQIQRWENPSLFTSLEKRHPYKMRVAKIMSDGRVVWVSADLLTLPSNHSVRYVMMNLFRATNSIREYGECTDD